MKTLWLHLLALAVVLFLLQPPQIVESLKIKKIVKDAAKMSKKYGYLLASRKKKLYAIPFPMPLPVFIKRQHIYTQVPIIPRYVQHPQPYGAPSYQMESAYDPLASSQTSPPGHMETSSDSAADYRAKKSANSPPSSYQEASSQVSSSSSSATGGSNKYLSTLASIIGQSVPVFGQSSGKSNRDLMTKLLNGQAKILPPSSLISAIKGPSSALAKYQKLHQQQDNSSKDQDQESKHESASSTGGQQQNTSGETTKTTSDSSSSSSSSSAAAASESARPSASEVVYRARYRPAGRYQNAMLAAAASEQRLRVPMAAMMQANSMMLPFAAMAAAQAPNLAARVPLNQLAAADQYLALLDSAQMMQHDQMEPQSSEPNEQAVDNPNQQQASNELLEQSNAENQSQILEHRRQQLLKLALLKERQEAERLLEAQVLLARAKQLSQQVNKPLPVSQQQKSQLINYYRQQQIVQQLRQMRYLQLLQQQQQQQQQQLQLQLQLQQNSIDK